MLEVAPVGDRVAVKPAPEIEQLTESGLIVPDTAVDRESNQHGIVIALGNGKTFPLQLGDRIVIAKQAKADFVTTAPGKRVAVVKIEDVVAVVKELTVVVS